MKKLVSLELSERVAEVKLSRPERMNAITVNMLEELANVLSNVNKDPDINVIILTGAGKAFSAGVDLRELEEDGTDLSSGGVGGKLDSHAAKVTKLIEESPKAVIAKINGYCFTGALEIALAADLIYVANEAKIGDTHAVLGFRPSWGLTQRLPRKIGLMRAKELSFTAKSITGVDAKQFGIALESFPLAELDSEVTKIAQKISVNSPNSIRAYKDLYKASQNYGLTAGLDYENNTHYDIPEVKERVNAFLEKLR